MGTDVQYPYGLQSDPNWDMIRRRYADTNALGEDWAAKRNAAAKMKTGKDGAPNPLYPRYALEAEVARLTFDMAYLVESNRLLKEQNDIFSELFQRVGILEGAYGHLMASVQTVKLEYYNKLKKFIDKQPAKGDNDARD